MTVADVSGSPAVSVLMPAYNAGKYLRESVESILGQSFRNFEFLIADDGSTDETRHLLSAFRDDRIRVITNAVRAGVPASLNLLLSEARGNFIARMDADDISYPDRLAAQVEFMETNPDVGVCGMWCTGFGTGAARNFSPPGTDPELRFELFFDNPIPHPTVMIRKSLLADHNLKYDESFGGAEDYDLWSRAADVTRFAVIPRPGLQYRFHELQATQAKMEDQTRFASVARARFAHRLIPDASGEQLDIHRRLTSRRPSPDADWLREAADWVARLADANTIGLLYDDSRFRARLARMFFDNASMVAPRTRGAWSAVRDAKILSDSDIAPGDWMRFGIRCAAYYGGASRA